jgi:hypothetical protein
MDHNPFDEEEVPVTQQDEDDDEASVDLPPHVLEIIERFQGRSGDQEDETIIVRTKTEVTVWSSIGSDICKILKRVGATAKVSTDGNGVWITVAKGQFRGPHAAFKTGKRRAMTDEQRRATAERFAAARARKAS